MAVKTSVTDPNMFYADPDSECFFNTVPDPECFSMRKLIQVKKYIFLTAIQNLFWKFVFQPEKFLGILFYKERFSGLIFKNKMKIMKNKNRYGSGFFIAQFPLLDLDPYIEY